MGIGCKIKHPRFIHGQFSNKSWLVNRYGKRITPKFKLNKVNHIDGFVLYNTNIGDFVCHVMQENILYTNTDITANICIYKETDFLYSIMYEQVPNKIILFTSYGKYLGEFSKLSTENSGMLAAKKNGNCGYIDSHGNEVIPFVYTFAHSFNDNGYAIVGDKDSKMSVIDKYGHMLFKPILVNSMNFLTRELLKIEKQKVGVIDLKGKEIIPCIYEEVWQRSSYIRVMRNNKHGLFNMKGECLLDCVYSEIIETTDKFVVRDNNKNVVPQVIIKH